MFTTDEEILELVAENDQTFEADMSQDLGFLDDDEDERPATGDGSRDVDTEVILSSAYTYQ